MPPPNIEGVPGVQAVLTVTQMTENQIERFIEYEGITSIDDLKAYADRETVIALVSALSKTRPVGNQVRVPQRLIVNIVAVGTWVKDMHRRNRTPQSAEWNNLKQEEYKQEVDIRSQKKELDLKPPKQCPANNTAEWRPWKRETENYIASIPGVDGVSLDYIIRDETLPDDYVFTSEAERRKYELQLEGAEFMVDNKTVWQVLKKLVSGTTAWSWIEKYDKTGNGRGAYRDLCAHFDGPGETEKVEAIARRDLSELKYLGQEHVFSFERFTTKLQSCFNILDKEYALESLKVRAMFDRIHTNHPALIATIAMVKGKRENKESFVNASNELSEEISQLFPAANKFTKRQNREIYEMGRGRGHSDRDGRGRSRGERGSGRDGSGRGRRGSGRGRSGRGSGRGGSGRGGEGGHGRSMIQPVNNKINGVDVTNPNRTFSTREFSQLGDGGRRWIYRNRSGGDKRNVEEIDSTNTDETPNQKKPRGATAGSRTGRGGYEHGNEASN